MGQQWMEGIIFIKKAKFQKRDPPVIFLCNCNHHLLMFKKLYNFILWSGIQESSIFEHLKVMVIEDMIYLIHVGELAEHIGSSLNPQSNLLFVDLEQDPPKVSFQWISFVIMHAYFLFAKNRLVIIQIVSLAGQNSVVLQLASIQKLFSLCLPVDGINNDLKAHHRPEEMRHAESSNGDLITFQSSELIDLSHCMQDTQVTVPTLNG